MAITGIGVDIEDISRFRTKPFNKHNAFYNKIFTKQEITYCLKKGDPSKHFAARFCAKEATIKALGKNNIDFKNIEIIKENKIPKIKVRKHKNLHIYLSISHTKNHTIAFVIITK